MTGPIGAGKNEVAKLLKRRGALVIDADLAAHELYKKNYRLWQALVKKFGSGILKQGGEIDRRELGEIVFSDPQKLKLLNRIVHPYLKAAIVKEVNCKLEAGSWQLVVINAAVLKEIGLIPLVDEVWVVTAKREVRLNRLMKKGLTRSAAAKRLDAQMPQSGYLKIADKTIKNDGFLPDLKQQLSNII